MRIGIFGGTFDPFTKAHLAICEKVLEDDLVDIVVVMPTVVNWHRVNKKPWLEYYDKERVIDKMTWSSKFRDKIMLNFNELHLKDYVENRRYLHMLADVAMRYGLEHEYYTIIGSDSLMNFDKWWNYKAILDMSKLIVIAGRDNTELPEETYGAIITGIGCNYADVSASKIREKFDNVDEYLKSVL